jgi:regulator of protease activity HflC (stomatin/prohibitin superfamily)
MHEEKSIRNTSGWLMLVVVIALYAVSIFGFIRAIGMESAGGLIGSIVLFVVTVVLTVGFFIVNPNEAAVLLLFGSYKGTTKANGFWWANPFMTKTRVSLRARNLNGDKLKVNDLSGNPIEIAAVVVWQVQNTAQAIFDVDDYIEYVTTQSESAVRKLASSYPYDGDEAQTSLRGDTDDVSGHLQSELQQRLERAGVHVIEARLSHLAYAPEIAADMLRRQQASAVVAARQTIVEGAVGMVEMALDELQRLSVVELDEERKAAMVSNLLVVLCSENAAQPVVNTGTLYH